jgi:hypothetical protein
MHQRQPNRITLRSITCEPRYAANRSTTNPQQTVNRGSHASTRSQDAPRGTPATQHTYSTAEGMYISLLFMYAFLEVSDDAGFHDRTRSENLTILASGVA